MRFILRSLAMAVVIFPSILWGGGQLVTDTFQTSGGELRITFVGHGSLYFTYQNKVIHIDPVSQYGDYSALPKADLVLVTHEHRDHLDLKTIETIRKEGTQIIANRAAADQIPGALAISNGEVREALGLKIEAVPAYNLVNMRSPGVPYHPKGQGNGYVITFADKRVYVAGDTENTPEMKALKDIDIAFLPMNLPYTMTPEMVADAAKELRPKVLYPYHYGDTDPGKLLELLKDAHGIEVRIRPMK